jgi:hypothetical protein
LKADYWRYVAEGETIHLKSTIFLQQMVAKNPLDDGVDFQLRQIAEAAALDAYKDSLDAAHVHLHAADPMRLGLYLNVSVFYHEILRDTPRASAIARQGFDDAFSAIDLMQATQSLTEQSPLHKEVMPIMTMLQDNIQLWNQNAGFDARQFIEPTMVEQP